MKELKERLKVVENNILNENITIMIIGLGSVGGFLLDYLVSRNDPSIKIVVVGRNDEKMQSRVNISRVAATIRKQNKSKICIESDVDLNDIDSIQKTIQKYEPDFIVNSSRAYPGLKYGSISWKNVRAYGIWTPLSIRFTKNILEACDRSDTNAIVINTSYSDAVNPWLASAGRAYPDFGSGNLNHLIPRIRFAAAEILGIDDFWNLDVMIATGHFHDVCISKEGQTEGVNVPLRIYYNGEEQDIDKAAIFKRCSIPMPTDATRNMMNASSNYNIIDAFITCVRTQENQRVFSPGALGHLGGYPVVVGYQDNALYAWIDTEYFSMDEMAQGNRESLLLDGIEAIENGTLVYSDFLIEKAKNAFGVTLPKEVPFDKIDDTAEFLINNIIKPQLGQQ